MASARHLGNQHTSNGRSGRELHGQLLDVNASSFVVAETHDWSCAELQNMDALICPFPSVPLNWRVAPMRVAPRDRSETHSQCRRSPHEQSQVTTAIWGTKLNVWQRSLEAGCASVGQNVSKWPGAVQGYIRHRDFF